MPKALQYEDFLIRIAAHGHGEYRAMVISSPAGQGSDELHLDASLEELTSHLTRSGSARGLEPVAVTLGSRLFKALFGGEVGSLYDESVGRLKGSLDCGLRIKLKLDLREPGVAAFHSLPWELLHRSGEFLALNRFSPIVRYLDVRQAKEPLTLQGDLNILIVAPHPKGFPTLDSGRERAEIEAAWGRRREVRIEFLAPATLENLRETLLGGSFHVLHFIGHGCVDPGTYEGQLFFEAAESAPSRVTGAGLAAELKDIPSLRLVVLNACETARDSGALHLNPFSGVATALMRGGIPAVVAMQLPIRDSRAIAFSRTFFRRLAAGDSLETAMVEARLAVYRKDPQSHEWAIPVLFMHVPDGSILVRKHRWRLRASAWLQLLFLLALFLLSRPLPVPERPLILPVRENPPTTPSPAPPGRQEPPIIPREVPPPRQKPTPPADDPRSVEFDFCRGWDAWSGEESGTVECQREVVRTGPVALKVERDNLKWNTLSRTLKDTVELTAWARPALDRNTNFSLRVGRSEGSYPASGLLEKHGRRQAIVVATNESDTWFYSTPTQSQVPAVKYSRDWTHLRLVIDTNRSVYSLWIDDNLVATDIQAAYDLTEGIDSLGVHSGRGGIGHPSYLEEIRFTVRPTG